MFKRYSLIIIAFICALIVIIGGDKIPYIFKEDKQDEDNINSDIEVTKTINQYTKDDNLGILVDIDSKYLYLLDLDKNEVIKKYIVATGKYTTPTPIGSYKIIQKARWGEGFGTRWMKLNVPWGQFGIHGTDKPGSIGYNSSHGCVRMRNKDIEELYNIVKYGTPVALVRGTFGPFAYGFRILKPGDRGADVMEVQKRLKRKGYYYGNIDGVYGDSMKYALYRFLRDNDMALTDRIMDRIYKKLNIILME